MDAPIFEAECARLREELSQWSAHCAKLAENNKQLGVENARLWKLLEEIDAAVRRPAMLHDRLTEVRLILARHAAHSA